MNSDSNFLRLDVAFVNRKSCTGHCVDVVCGLSIPAERREAGPVAFLHHGAGALESEMTTDAVAPLLGEGGTKLMFSVFKFFLL